jgi:hypothetical protein
MAHFNPFAGSDRPRFRPAKAVAAVAVHTNDDSRNNACVSLFVFGEGWHNNHHADPRSAAHGRRWFEWDLGFGIIRLLEVLGEAYDVIRPGGAAPLSDSLVRRRPISIEG